MKCFGFCKEILFHNKQHYKMSFQNVNSSSVYDGSKKGGRAAGRVANKVSKKVNAAKEQKRYEKIRATRISIDSIEYEYEDDTKKILLAVYASQPRKEVKRYNSKIMTNKRAYRNEQQIGRSEDEDNEDTNIGRLTEWEMMDRLE